MCRPVPVPAAPGPTLSPHRLWLHEPPWQTRPAPNELRRAGPLHLCMRTNRWLGTHPTPEHTAKADWWLVKLLGVRLKRAKRLATPGFIELRNGTQVLTVIVDIAGNGHFQAEDAHVRSSGTGDGPLWVGYDNICCGLLGLGAGEGDRAGGLVSNPLDINIALGLHLLCARSISFWYCLLTLPNVS